MDNNIAIEFKHVSKIYTLKSKNKKQAKSISNSKIVSQ